MVDPNELNDLARSVDGKTERLSVHGGSAIVVVVRSILEGSPPSNKPLQRPGCAGR